MSSKLKQKAAKAAAAATSGPGTYTKQQLLELSVASKEKIRSLLQVSSYSSISNTTLCYHTTNFSSSRGDPVTAVHGQTACTAHVSPQALHCSTSSLQQHPH
jgi:hypothetical protein